MLIIHMICIWLIIDSYGEAMEEVVIPKCLIIAGGRGDISEDVWCNG